MNRPQFDCACKLLIQKYYGNHDDIAVAKGLVGWSWNEHSHLPGFGYMSRVVTVPSNLDQEHSDDDTEKLIEPEDDATLTRSHIAILTCKQYVVYSATFQIPAFYFALSDANGSVLALDDIIRTPLFRQYILEGTEHNNFAVSLPSSSSFPLLSQGDHPTLGTPCWYFHPCETPTVVDEIMKEVQSEGVLTDNDRLIKWMEVWFMVLGTAVDMKQ